MGAYYNENDKFPAHWLRNLSGAGYVAPGVVDERSIKDVAADDVRGASQAHFFAGIGVWSYALRLAGWPDVLPGKRIWTGSCPCQPFSEAGTGKGFEDPRHLWPDWYRLIKECRPDGILGEQSASPDGREWLDLVCSDLEAIGYAVGTLITCSAGVGAPHQRHRLYFVAHSEEFRWPEGWNARPRDGLDEAWEQFERCGDARGVADAYRARFTRQPGRGGVLAAQAAGAARLGDADRAQHGGAALGVADPLRAGRSEGWTLARRDAASGSSSAVELAHPNGERLEGERLHLRERGPEQDLPEAPGRGEALRLEHAAGGGWGQGRLYRRWDRAADGAGSATQQRDAGAAHRVAHAARGGLEAGVGDVRAGQPDDDGRRAAVGVGDAGSARGGGNSRAVSGAEAEGVRAGFATGRVAHLPLLAGSTRELGDAEREGLQVELGQRGVLRGARGDDAGETAGRAGSPLGGFWTDAVWLYCRDGLHRPAEPRVVALDDGTPAGVDFVRPLARGVEGRVGQIKGFGNAINALQAAAFIRAFMDSTKHL